MNDSQKRISSNVLLYLPAKIVEGLISVFTLHYLSSIFSTSVNGQFVYVTTAMNFVYIVLFAWLANSASRYVGDYLLSADRNKQKAFYTSLALPYAGISAVTALVYLLISGINHSIIPFLSFFMLFGNASFQIFSIILVQTERRLAYVLISLFDAAGKLLIFVALGHSGIFSVKTPAIAIIAYAVTDIIAFLVAAIVSGFFTRLSFRAFSRELSKVFLIYGFPLIGVSFSVALLNLFYRFLLSTENLAIFQYNANISTSIFAMITISMMRSVYPSILKAYREKGPEEAQHNVTFGVRNFLLISIPAFAGLTAVSSDLSHIILNGTAYTAGIPVIGFAALAMLFSGLTEYANKGWELNGNTKPILVNCLISAVFNIVANLITIPLFGFLSAAVNLLLSYILYFLLSYIRSRNVLRLVLPLRNLVNILLAGLLCGLAAFGVSHLLSARALRLGLSVIAGAIAYGSVLWITGEIRSEMGILRSLLHRLLHKRIQDPPAR